MASVLGGDHSIASLNTGLLRSRSTGSSSRQLPDLTLLLVKQGIYEHYVKRRDDYVNWRRGSPNGAIGEMGASKSLTKNDFEYWYPTVQSFTFRRTCAYWSSVLNIEGSILLIWANTLQMFGSESTSLAYALINWPIFLGNVCYALGCYAGYFELINMDLSEHSKHNDNGATLNFFWCDWLGLKVRHRLPWSSILGWVFYMVSAMLFVVSTAMDLSNLAEDTRGLTFCLDVCGGLGFALAGACEVIHNRCYVSLPVTLVWWVSIFNLFGGISFTVGACLQGVVVSAIFLAGALFYLMAAVLSLCMWRGEQFGLALISVLNQVHRNSHTQVLVRRASCGKIEVLSPRKPGYREESTTKLAERVQPRLTSRGVFFIIMYAICASVQLLDCCGCIFRINSVWSVDLVSAKLQFITFLNGLTVVLAVHMALVLNSACIRLPKEEPYRTLGIMMRSMTPLVLGNVLFTLDLFFQEHLRHKPDDSFMYPK